MFSGSLVAIVTPMGADGAIDFEAWDALLDLHAQAGTSGIVVAGSTGESTTLSEREVFDLLRRAKVRLKGRVPLIGGIGGSGTAAVAERVRAMSAEPIDGILVTCPAYNRPTQEGLYLHFAAVVAAAARPIIVYNVPSRTAVDLLPATIVRLAKLSPIVAVKEATGELERVLQIRDGTDDRLAVLSGDDPTAREAVLGGARGVISVTANVVPAAMAAMIGAALRGERALAERLDAPLRKLHQELFIEPNPIPVKWALAEMGLIRKGIRLPLTWLGEPAQGQLGRTLRQALHDVAPAQAMSA
jgi:4-hydroxy-tetrahydrodipicolinate synthase